MCLTLVCIIVHIIIFLFYCKFLQVYSDLSPKPYEECGGNEQEALTGVLSEYFPILKKWILKIVETNKVCIHHACMQLLLIMTYLSVGDRM